MILCFFCWIPILPIVSSELKNNGTIPKDFIFGSSTSAYQSEGAWNVDGKGESIWDNFTHRVPSPILNGDTGDIAANSYYKYKEDIRLAADLGLNVYRFSISWTRILPTGYSNEINQRGLNHYKEVIQEILRYNMTPVVTLYHWDLPQRLFNDGIHWTNVSLVEHFVNYARIVINHLPEVGIWLTLNEPKQICRLGYGIGVNAPGIRGDGTLEYQCAYVVAKVHAAVYHMYKEDFPNYKAKMSLSIDCQWISPLTDSSNDIAAAERQINFECGMYFHPIFKGDWPEILKLRIKERSEAENLNKSRLPEFTEAEMNYINGTYDFMALNHYYTTFTSDGDEAPFNETGYDSDIRIKDYFDSIMPEGIYKVLQWITKEYGHHEILLTEIGTSDLGTDLNDIDREDYFADYICQIREAMDDGINIVGLLFWSFIDNLEWIYGYGIRYGLYYIDFKDPNLVRQPKKSVQFIHDLIETRHLHCERPRRIWPREQLRATIPRTNVIPTSNDHLKPIGFVEDQTPLKIYDTAPIMDYGNAEELLESDDHYLAFYD
ncbi:myrosinase 1-like isoform X1 [Diorhabda carinulata]|uniref:myrosinase 1-like isoform X1 n=1 Tax=Diorhabda carinulata TaxID=1163345 RepID=UPI0025A17466|nr:myrosinase 1-like isoform X1 [Diorhabda carinulata]